MGSSPSEIHISQWLDWPFHFLTHYSHLMIFYILYLPPDDSALSKAMALVNFFLVVIGVSFRRLTINNSFSSVSPGTGSRAYWSERLLWSADTNCDVNVILGDCV